MNTQASGKKILLVAGINFLLLLVPLFLVELTPVVDVPQHVEQVMLFSELLRGEHPDYFIKWNTPYSLLYLLTVPLVPVMGPLAIAKVMIALVLLFWTAGIYAVVWLRKRPLWIAPIVSITAYNMSLYWGLFPFSLGAPLLLSWFLLVEHLRTRKVPWYQEWFLLVGATLVLYSVHIFVLLVALGWMALSIVRDREPLSRWATRVAAVVPVGGLVLTWYPSLIASGFVSPTRYRLLPSRRLSYEQITDHVLGGWSGLLESIAILLLLGLIVLSLWQYVRQRNGMDWRLLQLGGLMSVLYLLLPTLYSNSIFFAERWASIAMVCLVLGLPGFHIKRIRIPEFGAWAVLAVFVGVTAMHWKQYERDELAGLSALMAVTPEKSRLLTLNYRSRMPRYKPVYVHAGVYPVLLRHTRQQLSFTQYGSVLVQRRQRQPQQWTPNLEWYPDRVKARDLVHFDYVLVSGNDGDHERMQTEFYLQQVHQAQPWRLYRVPHAK